MKQLKDSLAAYSPQISDDWTAISLAWESFTLAKGKALVRLGQIDRYFYFIEKGILVAHAHNDGKLVAVGFSFEGDYSGAYDSFHLQRPSQVSIHALEEVEGFRISYEKLNGLYDQFKSMERWGRLWTTDYLIRVNYRQVETRTYTATEKVADFLKRSPTLLNRIPRKDIASYLGISAETLSRVLSKE